jgi:membrane associated rhomboid family serine protease
MFPLRDNIPSRRFPFVTIIIILVNVAVFFYELSLGDIGLESFIGTYGLTPSALHFSNTQTLIPIITSMFMHGGWLHIIGNMWFLWIFGDNVEDRYGHFGFLMFYLASGIIAALSQYLISTSSVIPVIGASGAVAGVLGSYLILFPKSRVLTLVFIFIFITVIDIPAPIMLGLWFALQILSGVATIDGGISIGNLVAYWAHVAGFIFGLIIAAVNKFSSPKF